MKTKSICLSVFAVVFLSLIVLTGAIGTSNGYDDPIMSDELKDVDPTDMSNYFAMGEYYPPNEVDSLNIDWTGGRVEIVAYNGADYFVEEAATRQLMENERLSYKLEGTTFSVYYSDDKDNFPNDVYKKIEIRLPRDIARSLKTLNINTNGEIVIKGITAENLNINGKNKKISCVDTYGSNSVITSADGNVELQVMTDIGYSVDFSSHGGKLDSYVDNGLNTYVSGDGKYSFKVKTENGNLDIWPLINEPQN